jgi:hypothetical protein
MKNLSPKHPQPVRRGGNYPPAGCTRGVGSRGWEAFKFIYANLLIKQEFL